MTLNPSRLPRELLDKVDAFMAQFLGHEQLKKIKEGLTEELISEFGEPRIETFVASNKIKRKLRRTGIYKTKK